MQSVLDWRNLYWLYWRMLVSACLLDFEKNRVFWQMLRTFRGRWLAIYICWVWHNFGSFKVKNIFETIEDSRKGEDGKWGEELTRNFRINYFSLLEWLTMLFLWPYSQSYCNKITARWGGTHILQQKKVPNTSIKPIWTTSKYLNNKIE